VKTTRTAILTWAGYDVAAVETPEEALARLEAERFDLVMVGRRARAEARAAGEIVRERYPSLPILKVSADHEQSEDEKFATLSVDPLPVLVVSAVRELIGV
jgi:CheY-like chemotaxis protein